MAATDPKSERSDEEPRDAAADPGPSAADLIASDDFQAKLEAARRKRAEVMARKGEGGRMRPSTPEGTAQPQEQAAVVADPGGKRPGRSVLRAPAAPAAATRDPASPPARRRLFGSTLVAMLLSFAAGGALVVVLTARIGDAPRQPDTVSAPPPESSAISPEEIYAPSPRSARSSADEPEGPPTPPAPRSPPPEPDIALARTAPRALDASRIGAPPEDVPPLQMSAASEPIEAPVAAPVEISPPNLAPPPAPSLAMLSASPVRILARDPERLSQTVEAIRSAGVADVAGQDVQFAPEQSVVRFFDVADRRLAERLAERFGARLQDLTSYSPAPEGVGVDVWLAGT